MASEIPTHMPNSAENSFIPSLKFTLRALVICGLSYISKIFTNETIKFHKMGVFSNMNCKNSLISLHINSIVCYRKYGKYFISLKILGTNVWPLRFLLTYNNNFSFFNELINYCFLKIFLIYL